MTAIKEGPTLRVAKSTETAKPAQPDMKKRSLAQLGSYMTKTFLSQGLQQMVQQSIPKMSKQPSSTYTPLVSCALGLHPPHSVAGNSSTCTSTTWIRDNSPTSRWLHACSKFPGKWERATIIMLGKYKNGEIWSEGSGTTPCPSTCLSDKYKVTDGHLIPADNQFVALSPSQKYAIVPAKGKRIVIVYVLLKPEHVAAYQHALLTKHDFPVTPFALLLWRFCVLKWGCASVLWVGFIRIWVQTLLATKNNSKGRVRREYSPHRPRPVEQQEYHKRKKLKKNPHTGSCHLLEAW